MASHSEAGDKRGLISASNLGLWDLWGDIELWRLWWEDVIYTLEKLFGNWGPWTFWTWTFLALSKSLFTQWAHISLCWLQGNKHIYWALCGLHAVIDFILPPSGQLHNYLHFWRSGSEKYLAPGHPHRSVRFLLEDFDSGPHRKLLSSTSHSILPQRKVWLVAKHVLD